jgi:hypothetical protein
VLARRRRTLTRALAIAPGVAGAAFAVGLAIAGGEESTASVSAAPVPAQVAAAPSPAPEAAPQAEPEIEPAAAPLEEAPAHVRHRRARHEETPPAAEPAKSEPAAAVTPPPAPRAPDAAAVQTKLDRLTRESQARQLSPATAKAVKTLFAEVHTAYFRDDFARADALLDRIARELEK